MPAHRKDYIVFLGWLFSTIKPRGMPANIPRHLGILRLPATEKAVSERAFGRIRKIGPLDLL